MADKTLVGQSGLEPTLAPSGTDPTLAPVTIRPSGPLDHEGLSRIDRANYAVGDELARGGMGRILVARDRRLGRDVAIKELLVDAPSLRARFEREARITARLQHPAIVNVLEAGTWPSGEAFYVMKLVTGESLDKAVEARSTLAERLALLPHVIAAVDALAYAHSRRVIHRDLKPANVLVGEFGETVVIDWGLAKDLGDTTDEPLEAGPYRSSGAEGMTVTGAVMGTPAYMPVEQALGEQVDERADVYSLGALLYHVLVGEPPVTGKTTDAILAAVIREPIVPLARRVPGAPPDLVTIVDKALARDKADRYPTAKELAEDLKRFQTGQLVGAHRYSRWQLFRRWAARHRTTLAVAGVLVAVLAVGAVISVVRILDERAVANEQRDVAERRHAEAETRRLGAQKLIAFMLNDLHDQLAPIGKLALLQGTGDAIRAYYDTLSKGEVAPDSADATARAQTLSLLASVSEAKGDVASARTQYLAARAILLAAKPHTTDPEVDAEIALTHDSVAGLDKMAGDYAQATEGFRTSLAIFEGLLAREPGSARWKRNVARKLLDLGENDLAQEKIETGRAYAERANPIAEELVAKDPSDLNYELQASALLALGKAASYRYDHASAYRYQERVVEIHERFATAHPGDAVRQGGLADTLLKLATVYYDGSEYARARTTLERAEKLVAELQVRDPSNIGWRHMMTMITTKRSQVDRDDGRPKEALASAERALAELDAMLARDPSHGWAQLNRAIVLGDIAKARAGLGEHRIAITRFHEMIAAIRVWRPAPDSDRNVAPQYVYIAHAHEALGERAKATAAIGEARRMLEAIQPTRQEIQENLTWIEAEWAGMLAGRGERAEAAASYLRAIASLERVIAGNPAAQHATDYETYVTRAMPLLNDRGEVKRIILRGAELLETLAKDPARAAKLRALLTARGR